MLRRDIERTVRMSGRDVAEARRLLSLLADVESDGASDSGCDSTLLGSPELLERARAILAARRRRATLFEKTIFGEPAWEMLLLLYLNVSESRRTLSRLGELASLSKSTALRWIDYLDRLGLVRRQPHPTDKRAVFVELTKKGRESIDLYLSGTVILTE